MTPPAGEKRTKLDDFRDHLDGRFDGIDERLAAQGERIAAVETEVRSLKGTRSSVAKWLGSAIIAIVGWFIGTKTP